MLSPRQVEGFRESGYVVLRNFFDTLKHAWLVQLIEHRVADKRIVRLIQKLQRELHVTSIVVSHDMDAVFRIAGQIALLHDEAFLFAVERSGACVLMLHGVLHLLGYDHETDRGEMERVEMKLRRRLRLA